MLKVLGETLKETSEPGVELTFEVLVQLNTVGLGFQLDFNSKHKVNRKRQVRLYHQSTNCKSFI